MEVCVGVDVGGTFTDTIVLANGEYFTAKVQTTPADQSIGVARALEEVLHRANLIAPAVTSVTHGTTVATNALLERAGARTALVTTEGFRDLLVLARQARPHLYDLSKKPPRPIVQPELTFEVEERQSVEGVVKPLQAQSLEELQTRLAASGVDAVAICLLFGFQDSTHEQLVADAVKASLPDAVVVASHEIAAEFREFERATTTVVDAYLTPLTGTYLHGLAEKCSVMDLPAPEIMQSTGGVCSVDEGVAHGARLLMSGPAAGVMGACAVARAVSSADVVTFDMGGTSTDVSIVRADEVRRSAGLIIDGLYIRLPSIDIHSVGAGGGSIAWLDAGGALKVGPASAGSDPGPASYGRGGQLPTVTDANLLLGYLGDDQLLSGLRLDRSAAGRSLELLGLHSTVLEVADGIVSVANAEIARAIRVVAARAGVDPADFELVAFGGAGPLHAAAVADELGMRRVIVPAAPGVLSALGLALSDRRLDLARTLVSPLRSLSQADLDEAVDSLRARARYPSDALLSVSCDLRYKGQSFEIEVPYDPGGGIGALEANFHEHHQEAYGFSAPDTEVQLVTVRISVRQIRNGTIPSHAPVTAVGEATRPVWFRGAKLKARVLSGLPRGREDGPLIVDLGTANCFVPPGWSSESVGAFAMCLERQ